MAKLTVKSIRADAATRKGRRAARGYTDLRKWLRQTERKCIREGVMAEDREQVDVADALWYAAQYFSAARHAIPRRAA